MDEQTKSRRSFLSEVAATSALALVPGVGCARKRKKSAASSRSLGAPSGSSGTPRVVLVKCGSVNRSGHAVDKGKLARMLEVGLQKLAGVKDTRAALGRWVRPVDTVGLKVNCLAGRQMSTHVELVESLVGLLQGANLKRNQAVVFDRSDKDLRLGGFPLRTSGSDYLSMGNDRGGYERDVRVMPNGASRFSVIAAQRTSVLINLPILKDHGLAGLSGALKNNFGLVHNPNKFHLNGCDPHVAEVNAQAFVRAKQRLVICDALRVQTNGGPAYHPAGAVAYGGLLLANDPVALDIVAWEILEALRRERKLPTLTVDRRRPTHVLTAGTQGLGVADRKRITLIETTVS